MLIRVRIHKGFGPKCVIYICKSFALRWGATKGTRHWIENFFLSFLRPKSCRKVVYVFKVDSTTIQYSLLCTSKFKYYARKILFLVHFCKSWVCYSSSIPNLPKRSKIYVVWRSFPMMLSKNQKSCWKCRVVFKNFCQSHQTKSVGRYAD